MMNTMGDGGGLFLALLGLGFAFWLCIWLPASMAASRGRSVLGWLLLTLMFSPFLTILALLVLGPTVEMALAQHQTKRGA